jgi:hypothetical protein
VVVPFLLRLATDSDLGPLKEDPCLRKAVYVDAGRVVAERLGHLFGRGKL